MITRYVLSAADGRRVTNDTRTGVALTKVAALCYVWDSKEVVERERVAYQAILGTPLTVEIYVPAPTSFLTR